ncbi:MAG: 2-oxoisovalerate dehydrogenase [Armatimonadetes bacterium]|nr:2-oxoisovalerate dehydrogenase [Armatimonadota bacterium]
MSTTQANKTLNKLDFLKLMMLSREGDRREGILLRQSKGWFQIGALGHEAIAAVNWVLREDDWIFPYYRSRALMLARGLSSYDLALAYLAKRDSASAGRMMPGHYHSAEHNVFSVPTPTAGNMLPAVGCAWGMKLEKKDSLVVASVGDAASRQGCFYEALTFAIQESLPVIFMVEDNKYGISTPTNRMLPFNLGVFSKDVFVHVDAHHPDNVLAAATVAANKARSGGGPTLLWCEVERLGSHTSSDDHRVYRSPSDIDEMQKRDPITLLRNELIAAGELTEEEFNAWHEEIVKQVDEEYIRAEKAADPDPAAVLEHSFGQVPAAEAPPIQTSDKTNMVATINTTLRKALESDPKVVMFGEDIEDPKGGVFALTKGLSESFPNQVFNSPLAEDTILGVAVGMAVYGMKPVFELQFIDFISPGWNQVVTNMSTLRWRTNGQLKCPLVIYAPSGAYLPGGGIWHSMSGEGYLTHTTGLRVAMPSTPEDAAGLFWTAIQGDDPTFILVPKHIFRKGMPVEKVEPVPFGKARIRREGSDVTLVTWGNGTELAEEAAAKLEGEASVEIVDLRSLVPCDYETINRSLEKTGRLVVLYEDNRTGGFGQSVVSELVSNPESWNTFLSPPQVVARQDVPIGFNPVHEYAALPSLEDVLKAVRVVME